MVPSVDGALVDWMVCPQCGHIIFLRARDDREVVVALRLHCTYGCAG
ncbi:hypothetical protein [Nonomuraea glycinis]